jgi:hypothetical protein
MAWTAPQRLELEGLLLPDQAALRVGDEIIVTVEERRWVCIVVEISKRDAFSPVRWRAEANQAEDPQV